MPRRADPDGVLDVDRGPAGLYTKTAVFVPPQVASARVETRAGLRELDTMTEGLAGLTRQQRDRERIMPRDTLAPLGDPRMQRPLPALGQVRRPFSSRQKKARSKTRLLVEDSLPAVQYAAQKRLVTDPAQWQAVNDALSEHVGDVQALPDRDQVEVRRIDRAIQAYERRNNRGHVVYCNVAMPFQRSPAELQRFVAQHFTAGDRLAFDRYTVGTHQLHETTWHAPGGAGSQVAVFEIHTRRGAYQGHSDSRDDTAHLLPRGMEFEVVGVGQGSWLAPDGTTGTRTVIQLRDITPEPAPVTKGRQAR